jgi:hypothetical protein
MTSYTGNGRYPPGRDSRDEAKESLLWGKSCRSRGGGHVALRVDSRNLD